MTDKKAGAWIGPNALSELLKTGKVEVDAGAVFGPDVKKISLWLTPEAHDNGLVPTQAEAAPDEPYMTAWARPELLTPEQYKVARELVRVYMAVRKFDDATFEEFSKFLMGTTFEHPLRQPMANVLQGFATMRRWYREPKNRAEFGMDLPEADREPQMEMTITYTAEFDDGTKHVLNPKDTVG